jgi:DNA-binding MarR family transcriptional regulator
MPQVPVRSSRKPARRANAARVAAFQHLVGEVFRLNGQLLTTAEGLAVDVGVSPAGWQTVAVLRDGPLTVSDIARRLGLRRQSAQHNVDRLVGQGLVELIDNPRHRRAWLARLTRRGKATMKTLYGLQATLTALFLADTPLTAGELEALATLLGRLRESAAARESRAAARPAGGSRRRHAGRRPAG